MSTPFETQIATAVNVLVRSDALVHRSLSAPASAASQRSWHENPHLFQYSASYSIENNNILFAFLSFHSLISLSQPNAWLQINFWLSFVFYLIYSQPSSRLIRPAVCAQHRAFLPTF
jgi:hypothetical protein